MFSLSFDEHSLSEIAQFHGFSVFLSDEMAIAMQQAGDLLTQAAQQNTWSAFQNPTGTLAASIIPVLASPYEMQISVGVPYARRLEYGFNATDSLGRKYNEPAEPYLQPALDANESAVLTLFDNAVLAATGKISGGG